MNRTERRFAMYPRGCHKGSSKNTIYHKGCFGFSLNTKRKASEATETN